MSIPTWLIRIWKTFEAWLHLSFAPQHIHADPRITWDFVPFIWRKMIVTVLMTVLRTSWWRVLGSLSLKYHRSRPGPSFKRVLEELKLEFPLFGASSPDYTGNSVCKYLVWAISIINQFLRFSWKGKCFAGSGGGQSLAFCIQGWSSFLDPNLQIPKQRAPFGSNMANALSPSCNLELHPNTFRFPLVSWQWSAREGTRVGF